MNNPKSIWFLAAVMILALVGCNKKAATTNKSPSAAITAPPPTPIDPATVGEVTGKISFVGARPKRQRIDMDQDPACLEKHGGKPVFAEDGEVNDDGTLANVFVYVKAGAEKFVFVPPPDPVVLTQDGCMYLPHVLGIMAGQTLRIVTTNSVQDAVIGRITYIQGHKVMGPSNSVLRKAFLKSFICVSSWQAQTIT